MKWPLLASSTSREDGQDGAAAAAVDEDEAMKIEATGSLHGACKQYKYQPGCP
jgi:hypothetical protein